MSVFKHRKIYLSENELPRQWYNIAADMPERIDPYLIPSNLKAAGVDDLSAIFARELMEQELSTERFIDIPDEVADAYLMFRPSPLIRARNLEKRLDTPARIYYKYEGNNPSGSHKLNSAIPQAFYNKKEGKKRLTTETGAGQWGTALATAAQMYGLECTVYMVRCSYDQKPFRRTIMETYGANVFSSPSSNTEAGRAILAKDPDCVGALGIAISEAVEDAVKDPNANYALGSVLNHVILHQTIIGQEAKKQFEYMDDYPDIVIGCNGGGSNFSGIAYPFLYENFVNGAKTEFLAVESSACPKLTQGVYAYDFGDTAKSTPLLKMYTLGHDFMPQGIHAGGLRYHADSPLLSKLYHDGYVKACAVGQIDVFKAATLFAAEEFILPAPESAHAIAAAMQKAIECRETGESRAILFNLSGHGDFDLTAYAAYLDGTLKDSSYSPEMREEGLRSVPKLDV